MLGTFRPSGLENVFTLTLQGNTELVMCRLGSAWKPPAKLSFPRPRPSKSEAWAVLVGLGQLRLGLGSGRGLWENFWHTIVIY